MRGLRSTLVLLVIFLGLAGYIYFVESKKPAASERTEAKAKAFSVAADKIEELKVRASSGETASLKKSGATWKLVEPAAVAADESEISGIVTNLASLEIQRVVDETPKDLAQYGLATPRADVAFKAAGDKDFTHLLIGEKTATGGDLYARRSGDKKVFLVSGYLDGTFNRTPFDLREKNILKFERDKVEAIEIATGGLEKVIQLTKSAEDWNMTKPIQARADYGTVEGLVTRLHSAQMKSIAAQAPTDLKQYGLDKPAVSVSLMAGSSRAALALGKTENAAVYARDAARPVVFTVDTDLATDLKKEVADYRRKDLFEFRAFNATRLEIARGAQTVAFEKVKGAGKDAPDKWRRVVPAADVDASKMDTLLTRLANLRAQSFVESTTQTGLNAPAATVTVRFDDGKKQERVTFGRSGADVFAARADEPGAARLDAKEFEEALKALDEIK